jgi:protoheme IX farnesyltransferase
MDSVITSTRAEGSALLRAYYELTKPGIAGYVMITAGVSAYVASHGHVDLMLAINTMLGTGMATAGALAVNQWVERDYDARMVRTRNRPIPSGRLSSTEGWVFGTTLMPGALRAGLRMAAPPRPRPRLDAPQGLCACRLQAHSAP